MQSDTEHPFDCRLVPAHFAILPILELLNKNPLTLEADKSTPLISGDKISELIHDLLNCWCGQIRLRVN